MTEVSGTVSARQATTSAPEVVPTLAIVLYRAAMKEMPAFRVVLLHADEPARDTVLILENPAPTAPTRVRVPRSFAGAAAFDVYELSDDHDWPNEAIYWHSAIVPRTTTDNVIPHTRPSPTT